MEITFASTQVPAVNDVITFISSVKYGNKINFKLVCSKLTPNLNKNTTTARKWDAVICNPGLCSSYLGSCNTKLVGGALHDDPNNSCLGDQWKSWKPTTLSITILPQFNKCRTNVYVESLLHPFIFLKTPKQCTLFPLLKIPELAASWWRIFCLSKR